eukprot:1161863-Pelagomonas_calceolata.AAC.1
MDKLDTYHARRSASPRVASLASFTEWVCQQSVEARQSTICLLLLLLTSNTEAVLLLREQVVSADSCGHELVSNVGVD